MIPFVFEQIFTFHIYLHSFEEHIYIFFLKYVYYVLYTVHLIIAYAYAFN